MLIKACLNGSRPLADYPALPVTPAQTGEAAAQAVAAGAGALHIHPRGDDGAQSLDAAVQGDALLAVRSRCPGVPVGISTANWIQPDPALRLAQTQSWSALPDFASVNFDEPGCVELSELLLARGIGVEAGLSSVEEVATLRASGLAPRLLRILIEPGDDASGAIQLAEEMIRALDAAQLTAPRLLHGTEGAAWPLLRMALTLGYDTRIGLEDTLLLPSGAVARDNAELVAEAITQARAAGRW